MENEQVELKEIPKKSQNFSEWYTAVCLRAELADYSPVRGCIVFRPYGFALWENMREALDRRFKATGHVNAYFPMFVPESFLQREAEHVKGFAPQVAWVTHGGDEELTERLALRPTSEAIICSMYAKWIKSYRDLPVLINQWCNIVRWEKSTRLFLRTREFLWQEGHTCHRTEEEAEAETLRMLEVYRDFVETEMAMPVLVGAKPPSEKFPGAKATYTLEALMPDGQALQAGTSHNLGQFFSRAFGIKFLDADNKEKYAWGTSWGVTTRLIGGLVMTHGDDAGLILPPRIAPIQIVIIPVLFGRDDEKVLNRARALRDELKPYFRVELDERLEYTPGWKYNEYELRGVPLRIEIGPRDIARKEIVLVPRDNSGKESVADTGLVERIGQMLVRIQENLLSRARAFRDARISEAATIEEFNTRLAQNPGFVRVYWCGDETCENRLRDATGTTPRVIPLDQPAAADRCIVCGRETGTVVYYARSY